MYCAGLGLRVVGSFEDHNGFDGVMLGRAGAAWHLELTFCRAHPVRPKPTDEDLFVLYLSNREVWRECCDSMLAASFRKVVSFNPYWDASGCTFADPDGYRTVLQNAGWTNVEQVES
jgi:hypothetical protein